MVRDAGSPVEGNDFGTKPPATKCSTGSMQCSSSITTDAIMIES